MDTAKLRHASLEHRTSKSVGRLAGRSVGLRVGQSVGRSFIRSFRRSDGQSAYLFVGR